MLARPCVKTPYATEREANSVIAQRYRGRQYFPKKEQSTRIYFSAKCGICEMWHILSVQPQPQTKGTTENG